jgi:RNA-directed DNA polymerase
MKGRKQQTSALVVGCPKKSRTESEGYWGAQTFMRISEKSLVTVQPTLRNLLELIVSPKNLNNAYLQVKRNGGAGGIDRMGVEALLPYLQVHREELIASIMDGTYRPNPVRRVEIPKENGKRRPLGIPTVVDRVIQQAISQVLISIYDPKFSDGSCGFRPHRGAHDALRKVQENVTEGYKYVVDLDLEKFFDTVNHSKLIEVLNRTVKDVRVISLIHKYLNAGVMVEGRYEDSQKGVPQGGPLSPILSNIMLNELDKELERRGHKFVRYADDCMILCKSKRGAERTCESTSKFIEERLFLKVNREKTHVGYIGNGMKYLGHSFYVENGKCRLGIHAKIKAMLKSKLKELTDRSNGMGYEQRKEALKEYIRGWMEYYKLADGKKFFQEVDKWYRRRLRMCIWKNWKKVGTKFKNLMKCGIKKNQAWQWANTRQGYWHIAGSYILQGAITNETLTRAGYPCLMDYYKRLHIE